MDTIQERVRFLLKNKPELAKDKVALLLVYWATFDLPEGTISESQLKEMAAYCSLPEAVFRALRRELEYDKIRRETKWEKELSSLQSTEKQES